MELSLLAYKCKKCETLHYPNRAVCKKCAHTEFTVVKLPNTGKLLTFTHLHNPAGDFEIPVLHLGIVELDNGCRVTGQMEIDNPKIGMKVKGEIQTVRTIDYNNYKGIVFRKP